VRLPVDPQVICRIAREAGNATLRHWKQPLEVLDKADQSPVTAADLAAHALIARELAELTPNIPVLSEEDAGAPLALRLGWGCFWLVDPLDGTKEFIAGSDEYTVNIALIEHGQVRFGVVGVPARDCLYWGGLELGAWRQQGAGEAQAIGTRSPGAELDVVASRRHGSAEQDALLKRLEQARPVRRVSVGSSLKFCLIAEGLADLYPRFAPTSQWDTAAAQAVLEGAGGQVIGLDGERFAYPTRESWLNPWFIALGKADPELTALLVE
jgi:3'(2'), 5'-bisphosphate nucleotidase